jgi:hypothetical protein
MSRPSSIDKLPAEIREEIGRARMRGCTIDDILKLLRGMLPAAGMPSRSAIGRHALRLDALGEKMRRSRSVAEALASQLGDAPESQTARLNIELLHSVVMDLFLRASEDETEDMDPAGAGALKGNPEGVMMLAKTVQSLVAASKGNEDFIAAAEKRATERAKREAAAAVSKVIAGKGLTGELVDNIKAAIFGVTT